MTKMNHQDLFDKVLKEETEKLIAKIPYPKKQLPITDYETLCFILNDCLLSIPNYKDLAGPKNGLDPYFNLMKLTIVFNVQYCDFLSSKLKGNTLFQKNNKWSFDLYVILLWKQNLTTLISATELYLKGYTFQTYQMLRLYVESANTLALALLDYDFLNLLVFDAKSKKEYLKHWRNNLKPSIVQQKLKKMKDAKLSDIKTIEIDDDVFIPSFWKYESITSDFVKKIYQRSSAYIHFEYTALKVDAFNEENQGYFVGTLDNERPLNRQLFVNMLELFTYTSSSLVSIALSQHGLCSKHQETNQLAFIHSSLVLNCTFRGLYDFPNK